MKFSFKDINWAAVLVTTVITLILIVLVNHLYHDIAVDSAGKPVFDSATGKPVIASKRVLFLPKNPEAAKK